MIAGQIIGARAFAAITQEQLRRYAEASGDPNPIHLDEAAAKQSGLPGVIAHGMLIAALIAERVSQEIVGTDWKLARLQNRFKAMTLLGDVISVGGVVKSADQTSLVIELVARNQRGETTTTGVAELRR